MNIGLNINPQQREQQEQIHQPQRYIANQKAQSLFDPTKVMTNKEIVDQAKIHLMATKIGLPRDEDDDKEDKRCECCGNPLQDDNGIGLCEPNHTFGFLGSAWPGYYLFIKYCAFLLAMLFISLSYYNYLTNITYDKCRIYTPEELEKAHGDHEEYKNLCEANWVTSYSLYNKNKVFEEQKTQEFFNILFILLYFIMMQTLRIRAEAYEAKIDAKLLTPADYTVMLSNLPKKAAGLDDINVSSKFTDCQYKNDLEKKILQYMENQCASTIKYATRKKYVHDINLTYLIHDLTEFTRKLQEDKEELQLATQKDSENHTQHGKIKERIIQIKKKIEEITDSTQSQDQVQGLFTGFAFLTFSYEKDADTFLERYKKTWMQSIFIDLQMMCCSVSNNVLVMGGQQIYIERAPEPTDIFFENVGVSETKRRWRKAQTFLYTLFVLGGCFFLLYLCADFQNQLNESEDRTYQEVTLLSTAVGLIVAIINYLIGLVMRRFSIYELHDTWTDHYISIAQKISIAQFVSSGVIIMITNWQLGTIGTAGGLLYNIMYIQISAIVITNGLNFFNPWWFRPFGVLGYQKQLLDLAENRPEGHDITYAYARAVFEGYYNDISLNYSTVIKTVYLTMFYAGALPLGVLVGLINLFITYWVDKYQFLKRCREPRMIGKKMIEKMFNCLDLAPLFFVWGNIIFFQFQSEIAEYFSIPYLRLFSYDQEYGDVLTTDAGELQGNLEDKATGTLNEDTLNDTQEFIKDIQYVQFAVCIIYFILPWKSIMNWCDCKCGKPDYATKHEKMTYNEAQKTQQFNYVYDQCNPMTRFQALLKFIQEQENDIRSSKDQSQIDMIKQMKLELEQNISNNILGNVGNYARSKMSLRQSQIFSGGMNQQQATRLQQRVNQLNKQQQQSVTSLNLSHIPSQWVDYLLAHISKAVWE